MATTQELGTSEVDKKTLRRVTVAGSVGVFVEFYDYGVYGFLASTIATVFFPKQDGTAALLLTFSIFGLTFFVRPVGGVVCGYLGDRIGRQRTLVLVLMLISGSTVAIGLLPTYAAIGVAAPILLLVLRLAQGFSAGGESAGAMSFVAEYAPEGRRGMLTSLSQLGSYASLLLGAVVTTVLTETLGTDEMTEWGWRIPFLLAVPMAVIGFYIRSKLDETPKFQQLRKDSAPARNPLKETLASAEHRKAVLLAITIPILNGTGYYVLFSYMPTYLNKTLHFSVVQGLLITVCTLIAIIAAIPFAGRLSDRIGRKRTIAGSAFSLVVLGYPCYWLLTQGSVALAMIGGVIMALLFAGHTGVIHIVLVELFPTRLRYTAYALGYNISTAAFGGSAPFLMTYLISATGDSAMPAYYMVLTAAVTALAVLAIPETAHSPLKES
ncbi:MFS transporter [Saccharopolyspora spinosa]|uniref:Putative proline/betaine transporter n=1 Tax=Saccharopolyspora spinosa TaxID=60894 RepID=A0A2N3XZY7_SACSN|nr:MFS transporter [Saccharopolyspora spinosa]PKW16171.1 MHS family proline/betaine transporter-like MFS transporter [Saccharopolyspora spinosa]